MWTRCSKDVTEVHCIFQPEALERLESQILEQEAEISNVENRACFALHCIQMETQLVYANLEVLSSTLQKMSDHERVAHSEVAITPLFVD